MLSASFTISQDYLKAVAPADTARMLKLLWASSRNPHLNLSTLPSSSNLYTASHALLMLTNLWWQSLQCFENYFFTHWSLVDVSVALPGSLLSSVLRPLNTLSQCLYLWSWAESTDTGRWRHSVEQQAGTHSHQSSISSSSHTTFRLLQIISKSDTNKIFTSSSVAAVNVSWIIWIIEKKSVFTNFEGILPSYTSVTPVSWLPVYCSCVLKKICVFTTILIIFVK